MDGKRGLDFNSGEAVQVRAKSRLPSRTAPRSGVHDIIGYRYAQIRQTAQDLTPDSERRQTAQHLTPES
ncbi:MAG: hypothetical protein Q9224_002500 [Gallowayella concinna]